MNLFPPEEKKPFLNIPGECIRKVSKGFHVPGRLVMKARGKSLIFCAQLEHGELSFTEHRIPLQLNEKTVVKLTVPSSMAEFLETHPIRLLAFEALLA